MFFKELAREVMDVANVRDYNQGIMEFGAMQCAPKNPECSVCPLNDGCIALQKNKISELPVKINRTKVKNRYFNYLVFIDPSKRTLLQQRKGKGIWQNLWEFPLLETNEKTNINELETKYDRVVSVGDVPEIYQFNQKEIIHKLSHQHLHTKFWIFKTKVDLKDGIEFNNIHKYPVPVLIEDFIKTFKI